MKTIIVSASLAAISALHAQEAPAVKYVTLDACPVPVREALTKAAAGGEIERIKSVMRDGAPLFIGEIDLRDDRDVRLHLKADGTAVKRVTEVFLKDAPEAVRQTLTKIAEGHGRVEDLEQVTEGATVTWQAEIDRGSQPDLKVRLDAAGTELSRTEEKAD